MPNFTPPAFPSPFPTQPSPSMSPPTGAPSPQSYAMPGGSLGMPSGQPAQPAPPMQPPAPAQASAPSPQSASGFHDRPDISTIPPQAMPQLLKQISDMQDQGKPDEVIQHMVNSYVKGARGDVQSAKQFNPTFAAKTDENVPTMIAKGVANLPKSTFSALWQFAKAPLDNLVTTFKEDIPALARSSNSNAPSNMSIGAAAGDLLSRVPKAAWETLVPQFIHELAAGDLQGAQRTITNDPFQVAQLVLLAKGGFEAAGKGAALDNAMGKFGSPAENIAGKISDIPSATGDLFRTGVNNLADSGVGKTMENISNLAGPKVKGLITEKIPNAFENIKTRASEASADTQYKASLPTEYRKAMDVSGTTTGDIQVASDASPDTRAAMSKMIDAKIENLSNPMSTGATANPIGEAYLNQYKYLNDLAKTSGKTMGTELKGMGEKPVNLSDVRDNFMRELQSMLVSESPDGGLDFSRSRLDSAEGASDRNFLQKIYQKLQPDENGNVIKTPKELDEWNKALWSDLHKEAAPGVKTISTYPETIANHVRNGFPTEQEGITMPGVRDKLAALSPEYATASSKFAQAKEGMGVFNKFLGKQWELKPAEAKAVRVEEVARRLFGNAPGVAEDALGGLEKSARELGYKSDINPKALVYWNTVLERILGSDKPNSLRGQVGLGVSDTMKGIAGAHDIVRSPTLMSAAGKIIGKGVDFASKSPLSNKVTALKAMLKKMDMSQDVQDFQKYKSNDVAQTTTRSASEYRYHATSIKNLESIKEQGLKPSAGQYGKGVYFAPTIEGTGGYGSETNLLVRTNKNNLPTGYQEFPDQGFINKNIGVDKLEYSKDNGKTWSKMSTF